MYVCSTQQVKGRLQVKATEITPEASQCRHNEDEEGHQAHEINEGASAHQAHEINEASQCRHNEDEEGNQDYAEAKYYQCSMLFCFCCWLFLFVFAGSRARSHTRFGDSMIPCHASLPTSIL